MDRHPSYADARAHFNEPVLVMLSVMRLVGWGEDEHDHYYIFRRPHPDADRLYRISVVGGFIALTPLKGVESPDGIRHALQDPAKDDFDQLDKWLTLNGAPPAEEFVLEAKAV